MIELDFETIQASSSLPYPILCFSLSAALRVRLEGIETVKLSGPPVLTIPFRASDGPCDLPLGWHRRLPSPRAFYYSRAGRLARVPVIRQRWLFRSTQKGIYIHIVSKIVCLNPPNSRVLFVFIVILTNHTRNPSNSS